MGQRKLDELSETQPCISLRGRSLGHVTYLSTFVTSDFSETAEDTNLQFCIHFDDKEY